ncbi:c-type cytochrome [Thiococcus pfennigii]|jgi:cytochrome c551/c552|uniref:c-type cytochrome n=1 Tax=Thiococcus pfennigii TaxID=1057 RepID=UPI00190815F3|nr:c-type cytochrome [Thiococcus pfennigii]MBK1730558.1 cytochrome C biogenesis protein CcsA [Thiococcus pfennigii]
MRVSRTLPRSYLALAALAWALPAAANMELATASGCTVCHQVDKTVIGPAYQDVADRYRDDGTAVETLVLKVKNGGAGNWGEIPMTPHPHISDETIRELVEWILSM